MDIRHLQYFLAVAEELHFGRAAKRLHIAQPPLSRQIRKLEEELGVPLFNRAKHRIHLTHAGRVFMEEARLILAQTREAVLAAQRAADGQAGRLVIGFISAATCDVLPTVLPVFRERCPDVELTLRELHTSQQIHALRSGRIHLGLVRAPAYDRAVVFEPILREPLMVALPANHRLACLPTIPTQFLADEPFILLPRRYAPGYYDQLVSVCQQAGFTPHVVQEALQVHTVVGLVAAGIGIALVAPSVRRIQREGVVYRGLDQEPVPQVETAMAWHRDNTSAILSNFLNVAREMFRQ